MAPLILLILTLCAAAAEPAASIDPVSCSETQARKINRAWPESRKRLAAAKEAAEKAFRGEDPAQRRKILAFGKMLDADGDSLPDVARVLGLMSGILERAQLVCGGKSDKACASRNGYVRRGEGDVIHLCPNVFKESKDVDEQRIRNLIHESAHLVDARVSQPEGEGYCLAYDCEMSCPGRTAYLVADNWSQFVFCASGQKPDEGLEITASPKKR